MSKSCFLNESFTVIKCVCVINHSRGDRKLSEQFFLQRLHLKVAAQCFSCYFLYWVSSFSTSGLCVTCSVFFLFSCCHRAVHLRGKKSNTHEFEKKMLVKWWKGDGMTGTSVLHFLYQKSFYRRTPVVTMQASCEWNGVTHAKQERICNEVDWIIQQPWRSDLIGREAFHDCWAGFEGAAVISNFVLCTLQTKAKSAKCQKY